MMRGPKRRRPFGGQGSASSKNRFGDESFRFGFFGSDGTDGGHLVRQFLKFPMQFGLGLERVLGTTVDIRGNRSRRKQSSNEIVGHSVCLAAATSIIIADQEGVETHQ